jgi:adenylate cyclase
MAAGRVTRRKKFIAWLLVVFGAANVGFILLVTGALERLENGLWDRRLRFVAESTEPDPRIRIITIDQSSLDFMAKEEKIYWPWPRAVYEPVLRFLKSANAKAVGFDILFTEPSAYGVEDDHTLAEAMRSGPSTVVAAALRRDGATERSFVEWNAFRERQFSRRTPLSEGLLSLPDTMVGSGVVLPIPELVNAADGIGNVSATPDEDGIFRHATPGGVVNGVPVLSLPFELSRVMNVELTASRSQALRDLVARDGRLAVRFAGGPRTYRTTPMAAVIQSYARMERGEAPTVDPKEFEDAVVLIGMDAPGLLDLRPIPLAEVFAGVEFNANVLDNLMNDRFVHRVSTAVGVAVSTLVGLLIGAITLFVARISYQAIGVLAALIGFGAIGFQSAAMGIWIPMAVPLTVGLAALLYCLVFQYQLEGRQHRFLKHAFRHYVSGDVVAQIVENPASLAIGGERRELTIFFSDIAGFTGISEKLDVGVLVTLLNDFFSEMSGIIMKHGGTVDKYVGDAIVAFWNAPVMCADHAVRGVRAAVECQRRLEELRPEYEAKYGVVVRMRVGVHTGVVNVGNFGSHDRFNYTMIGDAANLASRLEGVNKFFGTSVLLSEATWEQVQASAGADGIQMRRIGAVKVVGREAPVGVYEPISSFVDEVVERQLRDFEVARIALEAGRREEALEGFEALSGDPVARRYVDQIRRGTGSVFTLDEK